MQTYYNTNLLTGDQLKQAVAQASKQEEAVLVLFQNTCGEYSPSKVMQIMAKAGWNCPITSWRRAMTNLTERGILVKMDEKVTGLFGSPEHKWTLKKAV